MYKLLEIGAHNKQYINSNT